MIEEIDLQQDARSCTIEITMSETSPQSLPDGLVAALKNARHVAILTGAGISAESGLPTFRDAMTGLWARFRPQDLATPEAFLRDPRLVWQWYAWRRELVAQAAPNAAHLTLVQIEQHVPTFTLITQNVDGLHQRAGSQNVIELHGNIARTKCFDENTIVEDWPKTDEVPPRCHRCGGLLRPDVVWFGEVLPRQAFTKAVQAATQCDLFFSIGTSGTVEPAASLLEVAQRSGAATAILNLDVTPFASTGHYRVNGQAGTILQVLLNQAWPV